MRLCRNALSSLAGLVTESELSFWVTDGLITKYSSISHAEPDWIFIQEMAWWLEGTHPDIWESTFALPERCSIDDEYNCWRTWHSTAETATMLLKYGPEFIGQSDNYSIGG